MTKESSLYQPNCVGKAYEVLGYREDGWYDPDELLDKRKFMQVPPDQAELVASVARVHIIQRLIERGARDSVKHVIAYNPHSPNSIIHRRSPGAPVEIDDSFYEAIGWRRKALGEKLIYLRRTSFRNVP